MNEIRMEKMREAHLGRVLAIEAEQFTTPWTESMFRQEIEDNYLSHSLVAMRGDKLVGYVVTWYVREEVHILNIAVATAEQRRGYGSTMLRYVISEAQRMQRELITLEVRATNHAAREMYTRFGFVPVTVRKNYYEDDREDAVVMILDLAGSTEQ